MRAAPHPPPAAPSRPGNSTQPAAADPSAATAPQAYHSARSSRTLPAPPGHPHAVLAAPARSLDIAGATETMRVASLEPEPHRPLKGPSAAASLTTRLRQCDAG